MKHIFVIPLEPNELKNIKMGLTFPKKVAPGGEFSRKVLLGVPNPTFWRNANGGTYYEILSPTILFTLLQIRTFVQNLENL